MEEKKKSGKPEDKPKVIIKTPYDFQRLKLEKLMKNPEKPVVIPAGSKEKKTPHVPEFVRNVMGSSAGAGSGEFHVYRHLRRKEYARQKHIQEKSEKELLDEEFERKIQESRQAFEDKTAKKRAKRMKKKQKMKNKPKKLKTGDEEKDNEDDSGDESKSEEENSDKDDDNERKDDKQEEKET
uniref:PRKR-interacting protein 1 homolog n=1 Tax=Cacopsylla melanoneura TaxID=428564 RepID=A0A8D9AJY5_9HEMI